MITTTQFRSEHPSKVIFFDSISKIGNYFVSLIDDKQESDMNFTLGEMQPWGEFVDSLRDLSRLGGYDDERYIGFAPMGVYLERTPGELDEVNPFVVKVHTDPRPFTMTAAFHIIRHKPNFWSLERLVPEEITID